MDVTPVTANGTPARPNPGAITPTTEKAMILPLGAGNTNADWVASYLSNFTQSYDATGTQIGTGIGNVEWTSGAYDPAAWTGGFGGATYAAITIALRPEA
jgi:hypothetical protein